MKTILVTGATDGIGKVVAALLLEKGHQVIVHGRDRSRADQTVSELSLVFPESHVQTLVADFSDLSNIDQMISDMEMRGLVPDVLLNNAAVFQSDHEILPNGIEKTFMVNYLAPYYLTRKLIPILKQNPNPRIVNVSSIAQTGTVDFNNLMGQKKYDGYEAYALSKLFNVMFTYQLHRLYGADGLQSICLHPGVINTKLLRLGWGAGGDEVLIGAQREEYASLCKGEECLSGTFLVQNKPAKSALVSYDKRIQERLWDISARLSGIVS